MKYLYLKLIVLSSSIACTATARSQEWPHSVAEWNDANFQARVQGVYDWFGSSPERLNTFEFMNEYLDRPFAYYRLSTVNREIEYFPPRNEIDPDLSFVPPPKDWVDRESIIAYLSRNAEIEPDFFQERLAEDAGPDTHYLMGNIYFLQGRLESAIDSYRQAIQEFPRFRLAYKNMAYAYFKLGNCVEAQAASRQATEFRAFTARLKGIEGYCSFEQGKYYSARESFSVARMLDPENPIWAEFELESLIKLGSHRQVEKIIEAKITDSASPEKYYGYLTEIYRAKGDQQELMSVLEIRKRLGTITGPELLELNGIKISAGLSHLINDDEFLAYANRAIPSQQEFLEIINNRASLDGWQAAAELVRLVVEQSAVNSVIISPQLSVLQAKALSESGQLENATELLERVLLDSPLHCDALLTAAETYWKKEATALVETYLQRAQGSSQECRDRAWALNADLLLEKGEYVKSLELYQQLERRRAITGDAESLSQISMIEALSDLVQLQSQ